LSACIDENTALDFAQGRLPRPRVHLVDEHLDGCAACRLLIDEAVRSFRDRETYDVPAGATPLTVFIRGDVLANRYRISRFIARGGMGEVYEAEDLVLGTRLAVKTMNAAISDDPGAIRRLKQEVNLARRITHENVCRIFDIGVHEPSNPRPGERVLFLTMELIDGVSLGDRLRSGGPLSEAEARPIVEAMVAALVAAHRAGVVHRDFKSDNVMLAKGEWGAGGPPRVVVMDFGLARATSSSVGAGLSSQEGTLTGTLAYMAPEQLEGRATGPATDVYALGTVMFEMLTGRLPFEGEAPLGGALRRITEVAPALRTQVPGIDPAWDLAVSRCLEREPARRPASVDEVMREIAGEVSAAPVVISAPRRRARAGVWRRGALGVAALLAMVGVTVLALRGRRGEIVNVAPAGRAWSVPAASGEPARAAGGGHGDGGEVRGAISRLGDGRARSEIQTVNRVTGAVKIWPARGGRSGHLGGALRGGGALRAASTDGRPRRDPDPEARAARADAPAPEQQSAPPRSQDPEDGFILRP
jgi:Protein kinase domain